MASDPVILAFDTSVAHCAAALLYGDEIIAQQREELAKGQAERLLPLLENILSDANSTWQDLTAIGVGIGPGNFTGIRISVASARGLALSLGIPAIGISNLEAQAYNMAGKVYSILDARRDSVFLQAFDHTGGQPPRLCATADIPVEDATYVGYLPKDFFTNFQIVTAPAPENIATNIARIATGRIGTPHPRPAPLYIRQADAAPPRNPAPVILS